MLELISILCSLVLVVLVPVQASQICAGKISPKYKGTPQAYAAAFRKQISVYVWLGAVFGALDLVLILIDTEPGEWLVQVVASVLWFGVCAASLYSRQRLTAFMATTEAVGT